MPIQRKKGESKADWQKRQEQERERLRALARRSNTNQSESGREARLEANSARRDFERSPHRRRSQKQRRDDNLEDDGAKRVREAGAAASAAIIAADEHTDADMGNEQAEEPEAAAAASCAFSSENAQAVPQPGPSSRLYPPPPMTIQRTRVSDEYEQAIIASAIDAVIGARKSTVSVEVGTEQQDETVAAQNTTSAAKKDTRPTTASRTGPERRTRKPKTLRPKRISLRIAKKTRSPTSYGKLIANIKKKTTADANDGQDITKSVRHDNPDNDDGSSSSSSNQGDNDNAIPEAVRAPQRVSGTPPLSQQEVWGRVSLSSPTQSPPSLTSQELRNERLLQWLTDERGVEQHCCGQMRYECGSCYAMHFLEELTRETQRLFKNLEKQPAVVQQETRYNISMCCSGGKVSLPPLPPYPQFLRDLMSGKNTESGNFRNNLRRLNNSFAFSCMQANFKGDIPRGGGSVPPQVYVIQGQVYHQMGTLHPPDENIQRQYAQIYILDQSMAVDARMGLHMLSDCPRVLIEKLTEFFHEHNPFAKSYRRLHEVEEEFRQENPGVNNNLCMAIYDDRTRGKKNYNQPTDDTEVAVIFDNVDGLPPEKYDLVVFPRSTGPNMAETGNLKTIHFLNPNLEPMSFPILFPFGSQGWGPYSFRKGRTETYVTPQEYYAHRFCVRIRGAPYEPPLTWCSQSGVYDSMSTPNSPSDYFSPFIHAGRLSHQYMVDAYVRIEANRLRWYREHQKELRASSYAGFVDSFGGAGGLEAEAGGGDGANPRGVGKTIILPSGYQGGPRYMQQLYQDAMAMVHRFGKPDLFITMTCNPKWKEITDNLERYETHADRPDLVARVFHLKAKALQQDIIKTGIFGEHLASVDVIEFQKRGLPHLHMLLILRPESKMKTSEDIDKIVSAEIPDARFPLLREKVLSNMIHMPCGPPYNDKRCRGPEGTENCKKKFPKPFSDTTVQNVHGYPIYRRRAPTPDNPATLRGGKEVDNSWVVPYNPYLLLKYDCHINVEVVASANTVKYIYKYVYKGHDAAYVGVHGEAREEGRDEIKEFIDARYVSAPESIWRIFKFPMNRQSHIIKRLAVHLPGQQNVTFNPAAMETEEGRQLAVERVEQKHTTLTAWFKLNEQDPAAREIFYWQIPESYIADARTGLWRKRQLKTWGERTIGRMYTVNVRDPERWFLRLILVNDKGFTSFQDILTVRRRRIQRPRQYDGGDNANAQQVVQQIQQQPSLEEEEDMYELVVCNTFREAAVEWGYATDDNVLSKCLAEADMYQMPSNLRIMFAVICVMCGPSEPEKLWKEFRQQLTEDICHVRGVIYDEGGDNIEMNLCEQIALAHVREVLKSENYKWTDLKLPFPPLDFVLPAQYGGTAISQYSENYYPAADQAITRQVVQNLNRHQRVAYMRIIVAHSLGLAPISKCFFLDGPGGTGKTYLYKTLIRALSDQGVLVLSCATTGIAANLLKNGRTMHSLFGLPPNVNEDSTSTIVMESEAAQMLADAGLILMDECTMAAAHAADTIDKLLRDIMAVKKEKEELRTVPYGGKVILFGGDFRQCLCVVPRGNRQQIVNACLQYSKSWSHFVRLTLEKNMRAAEDQEYCKWLLKVGNGMPMYGPAPLETGLVVAEGGHTPAKNTDLIEIPVYMIETGNLVDSIFAEPIENNDYETLSQRAILCPKNTQVDQINDAVMKLLPGQMRTFLSCDSAECEDEAEKESYPVENLNSMNESGLPPHKLSLKVNSIVILLCNIHRQGGLCNGTRLRLLNIDCSEVVLAQILTGSHEGQKVFILRVPLTSSSNSDLPITLRRFQFPFKPAFAMTINKSQGQTLDMVGIFLPEPVFGHGQLYVALSRVRASTKVKVKILNTLNQGKLIPGYKGIFTRNIVYREVLQQASIH